MSAVAAQKAVTEATNQTTRRLTEQNQLERRSAELKAETLQRDRQATAMQQSAASAAQQAALAQVRGQNDLQVAYDRLAHTIEAVQRAFASGAIDADLAQKKIQEATNRTTLEIERQKKAESDAAKALQSRAAGVTAIGTVYNTVSGHLMSYVRSGLAASAQGHMIELQFQMISREVAALFLPAINQTIAALSRVTTWFRSLSSEQQESIGKWIMLGVGALGVASALPKVAAGFEIVGTAMRTAMNANPILLVAGAVAALLLSTESGRRSLASLAQSTAPIFQRVAESVERLAPAWERAAEAISVAVRALEGAIRVAETFDRAIGQHMGTDSDSSPLSDILLGNRPGDNPLRDAFAEVLSGGLFSAGQTPARPETPTHNQLDPKGGGMQDTRALFARLQQAANTADVPQQQLRVQQESRDILADIQRKLPPWLAGLLRGGVGVGP